MTKKNIKKNYKNKNYKNKKCGGKTIASGGFGCVFSPSLRCEGSTTRSSHKISKLMYEKYAKDEYQELSLIHI